MGDVSMRLKAVVGLAVLVSAVALCATASAGTALVGSTFPVSYLDLPANAVPGGNSGTMGPGYTSSPTSTDGRYVFFFSGSDNLASGINPDQSHLFRKDTQSGDVILVDRADGKDGAPLGNSIFSSFSSGDGNLVAFSTNVPVVPADTDDSIDVYLRNIQAGTTTLLTPSVTDDAYLTDISADGKYVVFTTSQALAPGDSNTEDDIYRMKVADGTSTLVSAKSGSTDAGNGFSQYGTISGNGRWAAFSSSSTDLVAGFSDNNGAFSVDIFLRDIEGGSTYLVSAKYNNATASANDGSGDAHIAGSPNSLGEVEVAFSSYATDLLDNGVSDLDNSSSVYVRNMTATPSELISRASGAGGANADSRAHTPSISNDGTRVIFSSDAENLGPPPDYYGVYMRHRDTNLTSLVSYRNNYAVEGAIAGDGQSATWVEYGGATPDSDPDLTSVFRRTLPSGAFSLVSRPKGNAPVRSPGFEDYSFGRRTISATGRYAVFTSGSAHVPEASDDGRSQIYRRDLKTGELELVSRASGATGAKAEVATDASISSDGTMIAFTAAGQLVPADTNDQVDVYVRNLDTDVTTLVSRADGLGGAVGDENSDSAVISGDGKRVAFRSQASNLGAPGVHRVIYIRDLAADKTFIVSRADGESGDLADGDSDNPSLSYDGSKVVFTSYATNLNPDDITSNQSIYLRNLTGNSTSLVSRAPGLSGASLTSYSAGPPVISGNGNRVAFSASDQAAVPATAPWPVGTNQVVVRDLADGSNRLGSISSSGQAGDSYSSSPSLSRDGNVLAFSTDATNLRDDVDNTGRTSVVIRDLGTGKVSGPPLFGIDPFKGSSTEPVVSDSGNCIAYRGFGHNKVSGNLGDLNATYVYVRSGTCLNPRVIVPKLSGVRLKPKKFRVAPKATAKAAAKKKRKKSPRGTKIRFKLNTKATVTVWIERKLKGRKSGKKCVKATRKNRRKKACTRLVRQGKLVRKDLAAGRRKIAFTGRIGRKALKPGRYRVVLQAVSGADKSNRPVRPFKVVKR